MPRTHDLLGSRTPEATKAGITLDEHADNAVTSGDAWLLKRLVHNLVENGVRHNTGPGGHATITSRTRDGSTVELEVTNTGPVVPQEEIPALFEPFRRRHTSCRNATHWFVPRGSGRMDDEPAGYCLTDVVAPRRMQWPTASPASS